MTDALSTSWLLCAELFSAMPPILLCGITIDSWLLYDVLKLVRCSLNTTHWQIEI
jgi:hypothetical protein